MDAFKEPHGGKLKDLYLDAKAAELEEQAARDGQSWDLAERQLCEIELAMNGGFSPLDGFLDRDDQDAVVSGMLSPDLATNRILVNLEGMGFIRQ